MGVTAILAVRAASGVPHLVTDWPAISTKFCTTATALLGGRLTGIRRRAVHRVPELYEVAAAIRIGHLGLAGENRQLGREYIAERVAHDLQGLPVVKILDRRAGLVRVFQRRNTAQPSLADRQQLRDQAGVELTEIWTERDQPAEGIHALLGRDLGPLEMDHFVDELHGFAELGGRETIERGLSARIRKAGRHRCDLNLDPTRFRLASVHGDFREWQRIPHLE